MASPSGTLVLRILQKTRANQGWSNQIESPCVPPSASIRFGEPGRYRVATRFPLRIRSSGLSIEKRPRHVFHDRC
jgi:hypothetical protein